MADQSFEILGITLPGRHQFKQYLEQINAKTLLGSEHNINEQRAAWKERCSEVLRSGLEIILPAAIALKLFNDNSFPRNWITKIDEAGASKCLLTIPAGGRYEEKGFGSANFRFTTVSGGHFVFENSHTPTLEFQLLIAALDRAYPH